MGRLDFGLFFSTGKQFRAYKTSVYCEKMWQAFSTFYRYIQSIPYTPECYFVLVKETNIFFIVIKKNRWHLSKAQSQR